MPDYAVGPEPEIAAAGKHRADACKVDVVCRKFFYADAVALNQNLLKQGVIVRPIAGYGMPEWLRVTIGSETENARFLEALELAQ